MDSDLSIIVMSENLDLPPSQTISLQDLVKQDVNAFLDKSIASGHQFSVHEIEKLVLQSFDKHLKSHLDTPFPNNNLDAKVQEINYLDLFDYRVNTFLDACEMSGIDIQKTDEAPMIAELDSVPVVKEPIVSNEKSVFRVRGTKVLKVKQRKVPVQYSEPRNCALRAVKRKIRNIQQFIKEGTIYETNKPCLNPRMNVFNKIMHSQNLNFPLMPQTVKAEKKVAPKPKFSSQFIYYGN